MNGGRFYLRANGPIARPRPSIIVCPSPEGQMDDDAKPPKIALVAENSNEDIQRAFARQKAETALVQLAANILRVVRGAGRPYSIVQECATLIDAFREYHAVAGQWPASFDVANTIGFFDEPHMEGGSDEWRSVELARNLIVRGALQLVASRMLGQIPQKRAGENELMMGFRELTEATEAHRCKIERDINALRAADKARGDKATLKRTSKRSRKDDIIL
jgi:hypothetical protein